MSSTLEIASAFIEDAPPGELGDVVNDIKSLTSDTDPTVVQKLKPAFTRYSEAQFVTTKLPGGSQSVLISEYNKLPDGRYFDVGSSTSWDFDHVTQKASNPQTYTLDTPHADLISSLLKAHSTYTTEHYPTSTSTVCPSPSDPDTIHILLTATKYSPSNFWNGRFRASYTLSSLSSSSSSTPTPTLSGTLSLSIHYYEDGNVRLETSKPLKDIPIFPSPSSSPSSSTSAATATTIINAIAKAEKSYQEEVNRALVALNEDSFKKLRRQLPVTRQKVEWEKVAGYRLGVDLRGGGPAPGK